MARSDNRHDRIRNGRFAGGEQAPASWRWCADGDHVSWRFAEGMSGKASRAVRIATNSADAAGGLVQRVRCKQQQWYRLEVLVRAPAERNLGTGRFELRLTQVNRSGGSERRERRGGPSRCDHPLIWREYVHTPKGVGALELGVFWSGGPGCGDVGQVRLIPVAAPETTAHPLAVPPPPRAYPPPRVAERVQLIGDEIPAALREALRARFGDDNVTEVTPRAFDPRRLGADAVVMYDDPPPSAVNSWKALLAIAESRVVVISPTLFARLASAACGGAIEVRTLRQDDDPLYVKVSDANFVTRGFALLDVFPYARYEADEGTFALRCFRRSRPLTAFIRKEGILTTLVSEAATDATTDLPVCLVRPTGGGAVVVHDLAPFASPPCTEKTGNLGAFVLLNALGQSQTSVGQFIQPVMTAAELKRDLEEFVDRFPPLRFAGASKGSSADGVSPIVLGARTEGLGLPIAERPTVLMRTGLAGRDWAGLYGVLLWLKSLVRPAPWTAPHVRALLLLYRFVWCPVADWRHWGRFADSARPHPPAADTESELAPAALTIDLVGGDAHACRVVVPDLRRRYYQRLHQTLPCLDAELRGSRPTFLRPRDGADPADRTAYEWLPDICPVEVVAGGSAAGRWREDLHVRVELPRYFDEAAANSLWRMERAVTVLEWLIGLHCGLVAVNREPVQRAVSVPEWLADGRRHVLSADGEAWTPALRDDGDGRAGTVRLAPGECLFVTLPTEPREVASAPAAPVSTAAGRSG